VELGTASLQSGVTTIEPPLLPPTRHMYGIFTIIHRTYGGGGGGGDINYLSVIRPPRFPFIRKPSH
jgi:hypothetical protein